MNVRSIKIPHNTVLFDYVMTILSAVLISYLTWIPLVLITVLLFCLGEIFHYFFGIRTNTLTYLGLVQ
jgi:hypothetical protein